MAPDDDRPLRIAMLSYRSKPHVGGQGVYVRHLSKALTALGHRVEVISGQPYPHLDDGVRLVELPSLDTWNDHFPARMPGLWEVKNWKDWVEVTSFSLGTFPEPLAFSLRAWDHLRARNGDFDVVHDNQSLGYGLLGIQRQFPLLGTIHHPIAVDRRLEVAHATSAYRRFAIRRWYGFTRMQARVARRLHRIMTVSESSRDDIVLEYKVQRSRVHVVPVGVDTNLFRPIEGVERIPGRLVTTASADVAMKGLRFLLEAVAKLKVERDVSLVVIGKPKQNGDTAEALSRLGLTGVVEFVSGVTDERIYQLYAEAELAVVPSLYEGFSLPAIEAMACAVPVVATTGGALPEVVGADGSTAYLVPPGDAEALAATITNALDDPAGRSRVGAAGRRRVVERWSWRSTADQTVEQYRSVMARPASGSC